MTAAQTLLNLAAVEPDPQRREHLARTAAGLLLRESILGCHGCGLRSLGRFPVPWTGGPAGAVLVGEAPGADEDAQGIPFVGRAGRLLDAMLADAGWSRGQVGLVNSICCRPPDNDFGVAEQHGAPMACRGNLTRQLAYLAPRLVVCLGGSALRAMAGITGTGHVAPRSVNEARREPFEAGPYTVMTTYHPAAVLRDPSKRPLVVADLAFAKGLEVVLSCLDGTIVP